MNDGEHIRVERVSTDLWRIYSLDDMDGEFIDCERAGMRELLDWLLMHAADFHRPPIIFNAIDKEHAS